MKYEEIPPSFRKAIGAREGFRKLGFSADDLHIIAAQAEIVSKTHLGVFMVLKTQGKQFNVICGSWKRSQQKKFESLWPRVCEAVNNGDVSQTDMDRMWQESPCFINPKGFVLKLKEKGFCIPAEHEQSN
jgi:hypothetical protein